MTEVILLCGYNNSGKSTTAKRVTKMLIKGGHSARIMSFATPLKQLASVYCDYSEINKLEQRTVLEKLATDMKNIFGMNIFAYTFLDSCSNDVDFIVVDDLRYPEEFDIVSEFYPTTVIKVPSPDIAEQSDSDRLHILLDHMKSKEYVYQEMQNYKDSTIKEILSGYCD